MQEATGERIRAVIEMSNYRPSDVARSLKKKQTNLVGVVISDIASPFSSAIVTGIGDCLIGHGYTPLFVNCNDSPQQEQQFIESLLAKEVAGLIVNTTTCDNNFLINIACQGIPVVLCDRHVKNYNFDIVTSKLKESMLAAVVHLKEQGYTRPMLFTQRWTTNSARYIRRDSFIEAVTQVFGYAPLDDIYTISLKNSSTVYRELDKIQHSLKLGDKPAVIGINSMTTVYVCNAAKKLGLSIPDEMGICGPEDWDWKSEMNWPFLVEPNITTMVVHSTEVGIQSAMLLLEKLKNPKQEPKEILIDSELCIRSSTIRQKLG